MAVDRASVIRYLSKLSPDELQDLILELEDRWAIEVPAGRSNDQNMGAPWGDMGMPLDEPEFELILLSAGSQRVAVMKVIREVVSLELGAVMAMVKSAPAVIVGELQRHVAEELRERLLAVGASVEIR